MKYLTTTSSNLLDIVDMGTAQYDSLKAWATKKSQQPRIFPVLDLARQKIQTASPGHNVLRYLLLRMNNQIIKLQSAHESCDKLSNLYLKYGCMPFERMPFCTSTSWAQLRVSWISPRASTSVGGPMSSSPVE